MFVKLKEHELVLGRLNNEQSENKKGIIQNKNKN